MLPDGQTNFSDDCVEKAPFSVILALENGVVEGWNCDERRELPRRIDRTPGGISLKTLVIISLTNLLDPIFLAILSTKFPLVLTFHY